MERWTDAVFLEKLFIKNIAFSEYKVKYKNSSKITVTRLSDIKPSLELFRRNPETQTHYIIIRDGLSEIIALYLLIKFYQSRHTHEPR